MRTCVCVCVFNARCLDPFSQHFCILSLFVLFGQGCCFTIQLPFVCPCRHACAFLCVCTCAPSEHSHTKAVAEKWIYAARFYKAVFL